MASFKAFVKDPKASMEQIMPTITYTIYLIYDK